VAKQVVKGAPRPQAHLKISLFADGHAIRPTTLLEPQWKVEDGAGLDDLDLWTIQWERFG
jgi:hypothetical protein